LNLCHFVDAQNTHVLTAEQIVRLIPEKIKGFYHDGDSKSKLITLGNIRYSMAEKNFISGKKRIKILLFDYKEAPIMYGQTTKRWTGLSAIESDSLIVRQVSMDQYAGWESFQVYQNTSQIVLNICDRFYLTLEGKGIDLTALKQILSEFKFEQYPR
jgi:hypothetical protein